MKTAENRGCKKKVISSLLTNKVQRAMHDADTDVGEADQW